MTSRKRRWESIHRERKQGYEGVEHGIPGVFLSGLGVYISFHWYVGAWTHGRTGVLGKYGYVVNREYQDSGNGNKDVTIRCI